jgi:hypothetical protein
MYVVVIIQIENQRVCVNVTIFKFYETRIYAFGCPYIYLYRTNLSTESETNSSKNLSFLSCRCIDPYDEGRRNYKLVFLKCISLTSVTFTSADSQCVKFSNVSDGLP